MSLRRPLEVVALAPGAWADATVAVAASRAGGLGVVDLEHAGSPAFARQAVRALGACRAQPVGVRLDGAAVDLLDWLIAEAPSSVTTVILTAGDAGALRDRVAALRARSVRVALSATNEEEAALAEALGADVVIAKGHEAGGVIGDETTFVLLQRLLARCRAPVWAHGGIGPRTVAACYAAGAAGVVLDGQLLLLRECRLPAPARAAIERLDGSETAVVGGALGLRCRVHARPRHPALEELRELEARLDDGLAGDAARRAWREAVRARVGWGDPERQLWPLGQDAALAGAFARRFGTVARAVADLGRAAEEHCRAARRLGPLDEGAPLARSHGTRYPILQGPMTRVSDTPAFAEAVAAGGGLPFLALALLSGPEVERLLLETRRRLGARPWGVGILGFVPGDLRQEQTRVIEAIRPPFTLIAGGRPDQALTLEQRGIPTYLHVPSPGLLSMFLDAGARRFVFEGRECGGHVGPRSSFVLWEQMLDVLLDRVEAGPAAEAFHVVFAGGIHDDRSAAMVSALAAPLAERGVRVGILMGTAYLFTEEAVASGAIGPVFQDEALGCRRTILLETGPGHATRCADTAFGRYFAEEKRRLAGGGGAAGEVREALEALNLGRLRIAAKGLARRNGAGAPGEGRLHEVDAPTQRAEGMFMIGQVASLRDRVVGVAELHRTVSAGAAERLRALDAAAAPAAAARTVRPVDVAIVGMATLLPRAPDVTRFWENVLAKVDAVTEIPAERWDWRRYYDPDPRARDKVYSKWGGFLDPVPFDPTAYGMPPNSLRSIEPLQLLTLEVVRAALADAGYLDRPFPRERTGVVMGVGGGSGDLGQQYAVRSSLPMYVGERPDIAARLPEWTEDSFAGILLNVVAGRVANRFDLGGVNYTVDAACASSLAAVYLAVRELEAGTADMMLVGGADTVQNPFAYLCFSKTQALSPRGRCRTFDAEADGIVISEGLAVLVLKRLEDAERDGDRIYAVIKAVGGSSDGRDRGLTAPRPEGQMRALERAYAAAGFAPGTVGLVEAHGTGTVAGDQAEVDALTRVFARGGSRPGGCAIGSVKSMIGHTKCAAGVAGLVKVALSLHHRVLPPTLHVSRPNPKAFGPSSPFYVNSEARPWTAPDAVPRRAGVSSFGFGGTNFHVAVEEYAPAAPPAAVRRWPAEVCVWTAPSRERLLEALDGFAAPLAAGAAPALADLAASLWQAARARRAEPGPRLAVVASDLEDLGQKLASAVAALRAGGVALEDPRGIYLAERPLGRSPVAFLFPGQGSQHVDMLRELAVHFPEVRLAFERADAALAGRFPEPLSAHVFPPPSFSDVEAAARQAALTATDVAQPALGAAEAGLLALLGALGLEPDLVAGHSYGEYVALHAAGAMDEATLFALSEARGRAIVDTADGDLGTMAAVHAAEGRTRDALAGLDGVWIANLNAPGQTMISGTRDGIDAALGRLDAAGLTARRVPVACAFHSPLVARARDTLAARLAVATLAAPRLPVVANATAAPYPGDPQAVAAILAEQLVTPVRFAEQVERLYAMGARVFVEVGPRAVLTNLVRDNLGDRPHVAVAPGAGDPRAGLVALLHALARLVAHDVPLDLDRLWWGRHARLLDLDALAETTRPAPVPASAWLVHGGQAWPAHQPAPAPAAPLLGASEAAAAPLAMPGSNGRVAVPRAQPALPAPTPTPAAPPAGRTASGADEVMLEYQRLMSRFLETQRRVMLAYLGGDAETVSPEAALERPAEAAREAPEPVALAPAAGSPPPAAAPVAAGPATPDAAALTAHLVQIVSERTGYPPDMLGLDLNLEADLGIDSIKRVEILGAFLRAHAPSRTQELMERLSAVKTLRQAADLVGGLGSAPAPAAATTPVADAEAPEEPSAPEEDAAPEADAEAPRFRLVAVEAPLAEPPPLPVLPGPVLVTDDGGGVAAATVAALRSAGVRTVLIRHQVGGPAALGAGAGAADLTSPDDIEGLARLLRQGDDLPAGIVHLLPLRRRADLEALDLEGWRREIALDVGSLFGLARAFARDVQRAGETSVGLLVTATGLGGAFGSLGSGAPVDPVPGGVAGFVKTAALEWPGVRAKVVDVEPTLAPEAVAALVLREARAGDGLVEVGYQAGRRVALRPRPAPLDALDAATPIDAGWVVLVTGGGRGITAEVARELAERYKPTLVIVGRSAPPAAREAAETAGLGGSALRRALAERLGEHGRPPAIARVEAAYARLVQDRELREALQDMRRTGAPVHYHQVDVRDEAAFGALIDDLYARHGRIDAVLHGAGVIEDRLIADKAADAFQRVVGTKLDGAFVLARRLRPEATRVVAFFSSVAARFGNAGQADYAAANEVLNKLAVRLDRAWPTRVVALGWGPWGGRGMVSPAVERQFRARGVQVISPRAGRRAAVAELCQGGKGASEVLLGGGRWEAARPASAVTPAAALPLLNGTTPTRNGSGAVELVRALDPTHDVYLADHRLDGRPVFPAAMALELMAEVVQHAWPGWSVVGVRGLRVLRGIVLDGGPKTVRVVARPAPGPAGPSGLSVDVEVLEGEAGRASYRATVELGARLPEDVVPVPAVAPAPAFPLSVAEAYERWLFHGPAFQAITAIDGMDAHSISAVVRPSAPARLVAEAKGGWLIDPVLVDSAFQLAILWVRAHHEVTPLPSRLGAYRRLRLLSGAPLRCHLRAEAGAGAAALTTQIAFVEADGRTVGVLEDMEFTCSRALNRLGGRVKWKGR